MSMDQELLLISTAFPGVNADVKHTLTFPLPMATTFFLDDDVQSKTLAFA
jgi:hypothetical protein